LYLPRVVLPGAGARALLIVATERNTVYAFDAASHSATPLWRVSLNQPADAMPLDSRDVRCPFIRPDIGNTPTPVIDTVSGTVYVLARTKVRNAAGGVRFEQHLHALDVRSGADRHPPTLIEATVAGTGAGAQGGRVAFDALRENPRGALLLVNGTVYLSWASSCDVGPYHGWIMAYDAATLAQKAVFNTTPNGSDGGIWQGDAGLAADSAGNVYAVTRCRARVVQQRDESGTRSRGTRHAIRDANRGGGVRLRRRQAGGRRLRSHSATARLEALTRSCDSLAAGGAYRRRELADIIGEACS
jgi:hypothetical protein